MLEIIDGIEHIRNFRLIASGLRSFTGTIAGLEDSLHLLIFIEHATSLSNLTLQGLSFEFGDILIALQSRLNTLALQFVVLVDGDDSDSSDHVQLVKLINAGTTTEGSALKGLGMIIFESVFDEDECWKELEGTLAKNGTGLITFVDDKLG